MYCRKIVIVSGQDSAHDAVKGILTLEGDGGSAKGKLSVYHLSPEGKEYKVVVSCSGQTYQHKIFAQSGMDSSFDTPFTLRPTDKISVLIAVLKDGTPAAYGSNYGVNMWESGLMRFLFAETTPSAEPSPSVEPELERTADPLPVKEEAIAVATEAPSAVTVADETEIPSYNDEQIAEYNFYPETLARFGDRATRVVKKEAAAALADAWGGYHTIYRPRLHPQPVRPQSPPEPKYYLSVKSTIERLMKGEHETALERALEGTVWVKVPYRDKSYYVIGLIGNPPEYIGYAVVGKYALNPPRQLEKISKWLPLSAEQPEGDGYWVMFQDAVTGATVQIGN